MRGKAARGAVETCKALLAAAAVSGASMYRHKACMMEIVDTGNCCAGKDVRGDRPICMQYIELRS